MPGIASAATSVVIAHIAAGTKTIRVGAGGIMLPNHSPYVIAEQFGTLARLFPGRIDLGLGRAPGTDQLTLRALRRDPRRPRLSRRTCMELQAFLRPGRARPADPGGAGGRDRSADLDSRLQQVRRDARGRVRPALRLRLAFRAGTADSRARPLPRAASSPPRSLSARTLWSGSTSSPPRPTPRRGGSRRRSRCPSPTSSAARGDSASRRSTTSRPTGRPSRRHRRRGCSRAPSSARRETVRAGIEALVAETQADELIVVSDVYDHATRLRSFELIAEAAGIREERLAPAETVSA